VLIFVIALSLEMVPAGQLSSLWVRLLLLMLVHLARIWYKVS